MKTQMSKRRRNGRRKRNGRKHTDRHHIVPSSRDDQMDDPRWGRTIKTPRNKHEAWHTLFRNMTPEEAIEHIRAYWS